MEFWNKYKKFIIASAICVGVLLVFGIAFTQCDGYLFNRGINKQKQEANQVLQNGQQQVNAEMSNAANVKENIANLKQQEFEKQVDVNRKRTELESSILRTDDARKVANKRLELTNAIQSSNYANKSLDDAIKAQCAAFPDSPDCVR